MARKPADQTYPRTIKAGSVAVRIYRVRHANTKEGVLYTLAWVGTDRRRRTKQFADPAKAEQEGKLKAAQLAAGNVAASELTKEDRDLLLAIRQRCGKVPPLAAIEEWAQARELSGNQIMPAVKTWLELNGKKRFTPILAKDCVDQFITERGKTGSDAERTYRSKLKPIQTHFEGRELHGISTPEWTAYLSKWEDGVTRNDIRKRTVSMCRWAQRQGFLPRGVELEISLSEKSKEKDPAVGIIDAKTFGRLLCYVRHHYPQHLAALVLAGFAGIRSDEIHGKRNDGRTKRQTWEDLHLEGDEPLATISVAKTNTPSWRTVPLCEASLEWLRLCPRPHEGFVCSPGAMERVRGLGLAAGLKLPENCFRHSYISYRVIASGGDKHQVATWAGTSVERIDKHYRRPVMAETGKEVECLRPQPVTKKIAGEWFSMTPATAELLPHLLPPVATTTEPSDQ